MATRMQQRRGTASQWFGANPILNIGEIGYESDNNKFKIGDGVNHWNDLAYFLDEVTLGTSLDGYIPDSLLGVANGVAQLNSSGKLVSDQIPNVDEITQDAINTALVAGTGLDKTYDDNANTITIDIDSTVATKSFAAGLLTGATKTNITITGDENGLTISAENGVADSNTDNLTEGSTNKYFTDERAQDAVGNAVTSGLTYTDSTGAIGLNYVTVGDTLLDGVSGSSYGLIGTSEYLDIKNTNGYNKEIELDIAAVETQLNTDGYITTSSTSTLTNKTLENPTITAGSSTSISDLSDLSFATNDGANFKFFRSYGQTTWAALITGTFESPQAVTVSGVTGTNATAANGTQQMYYDAEFNYYAFKNVNFTGSPYTSLTTWLPGIVITVSDVSSISSTEIRYLDGVTSAIQTQLDAKAPLAGPTFTGTTTTDNLVVDGDFTVNGTNFAASATSITIEDNLVQIAHQNPANTVDLGLVVGYNDGTAKHAGLVKDTSANTWKLFKGVTTEPATTVDFTEGSLDDLAVAGLTASSLTVGDVSSTEFGYLNGVTSAIQTQLDGKQETLPSQTGEGGKYLTNDGSGTLSWGTVSGYSAPTLGTTSIASGATVTTISGLTDIVLTGPGSIADELALIMMGAL